MASHKLGTEIVVKGTLVAQTAVHVGAAEAAGDVDMPLLVDGEGCPVIPGTSVAGPVLDWIDRVAARGDDKQLVPAARALRGSAEEGEDASLVIFEDLAIDLGKSHIEIRDGVGIDRYSGTAAHGVKYVRQVLPAGVSADFRATCRLVGTAPQQRAQRELFFGMVKALTRGEIRFGAANSRGLGVMVLENAVKAEVNENCPSGLLDKMAKSDCDRFSALDESDRGDLPTAAGRVEIAWGPVDALMVKSGSSGGVVQAVPLTTTVKGEVRLLMPGSTIKGVLRSHAERIVRTVLGVDVPDDDVDSADRLLMAQLDPPDRSMQLVQRLFGRVGAVRPDSSERDDGAVSARDLHSETYWDPRHWARIMEAPVSKGPDRFRHLRRYMREASREGPVCLRLAMHVAIDRWTGGASDSRLYSVLEPVDVVWPAIRLDIEVGRLKDEAGLAAKFLLLMVLRDFAAGWLPLGFAVNRGMGSVSVEGVELAGLFGQTVTLSELSTDVGGFADCEQAWQSWCGHWATDQAAATTGVRTHE